MNYKIAIIVGSLRKGSYNRKLAEEAVNMLPAGFSAEFVEIGVLPLYNEDLESEVPQTWANFRQKIKSFDGVMFFTPEYNRSVPAAIKNVIDVGSRPYGQNAWDGKPAAVLTASTGAIGGFGSNHHLRQSLTFVNMPCMQQPEAYFSNIADSFDQNGKLSDRTGAFLKKIVTSYADWVKLIKK